MSEAVKRLEEYDTDTRYQATVVSSERITPTESAEEVRELVLTVDRAEFPYQIGQSIGILAPGSADFGKDHHFRLYSVADLPGTDAAGTPQIKICVRRCFYIDQYSGEEYPGVASNYLCDLTPGEKISITGPFGLVFEVPDELDANLILIGTGTGIAPFRAFVKHIYKHVPDWEGKVWLLFGAKSGLEMLYMNDKKDDFAQYYDEDTFEAFKALSPRPNWADPIAWDRAIAERGEELWAMFGDALAHLAIPAMVLATVPAAMIARITRASVGEQLTEDYVRTARAKGVSNRAVVWRHVMRNTAIAIVTSAGTQLGYLLGGAVLTETIFKWPGMGTYIVEAVNNRDNQPLMAGVLIIGVAFVVINLIVDLSYGLSMLRIAFSKLAIQILLLLLPPAILWIGWSHPQPPSRGGVLLLGRPA